MTKIQRRALTRDVWTVLMAVFVWAAVASTGAAQFRLPKVPGNSNKETKPSRASTYEVVSSVSPDSAPPGGHGQLILTGENFKDNMKLQFKCKEAEFPPDSFKVESPTRLVAQVTIPVGAQEGPCETADPSAYPTSTMSKDSFRISNSANMPVAIAVGLAGEGDMQFMDITMGITKTYGPSPVGQGLTGRLELDGSSIKYVKGSETSFTESTSAVKIVEQVMFYGQASPCFRIVFNDGKTYNFGQTDPNASALLVFQYLKKKLGK